MQSWCDTQVPEFGLGDKGVGDAAETHVQKKEPHLLAPFVARNGVSLVLLKHRLARTVGFLWIQ